MAVSNDLNAFGRGAAGLSWMISNVRLKLVSVGISVLMALLLAAGVAGTVASFAKVAEISSVWRSFDTGLARRLTLQSELRHRLGFGGLSQHFRDYLLTGDPLLRQAVTGDIGHLREIAPAYITAGASDQEKQALAVVAALVDGYERAVPRAVAGIERKEPAERIRADIALDESSALAAMDRLAQILQDQHKASADSIEDATWTVAATVGGVMVLSGILLLLLAIFFFWFTRYRIVGPLDSLGGVMSHLSKGDKTIQVPLIDKTDEIGDMARAVEIFKESMVRADQLEAQKRGADAERLQRAHRREELTSDFGAVATRLLQVVDGSVQNVRETADRLSRVAETTGRQAQTVSASANQAATNVEEVAIAAEQLGASGRDISRGVSQSASITRDAVGGIQGLDTTMSALDNAALKIGEIVTLISEIAAQTNLLALNASIEAQRAGDAGKGFAVVANEVKVLAAQTARATEQIAEQVTSIQGTTRDAMGALKTVHATVVHADEVVSTIASAVEEQNAATLSIARNVNQAAAGNRDVSEAISEVSANAEHSGQAAAEMVAVTDSLRSEADTMKAEVEKFLAAVKIG